jgi:hypothetical protein
MTPQAPQEKHRYKKAVNAYRDVKEDERVVQNEDNIFSIEKKAPSPFNERIEKAAMEVIRDYPKSLAACHDDEAPSPTWIIQSYDENSDLVTYSCMNGQWTTTTEMSLIKQIEQRARLSLLKEIADHCSYPFDAASGEQSYEISISKGEWETIMSKEQSGGGKR